MNSNELATEKDLVISGPRGSGKTTIKNAIAAMYSKHSLIEFSAVDFLEKIHTLEGHHSLSSLELVIVEDCPADNLFTIISLMSKPILRTWKLIVITQANFLLGSADNAFHLLSLHEEK